MFLKLINKSSLHFSSLIIIFFFLLSCESPDRNIVKRRIKEAYRFQKRQLEFFLESNNQQLNLAIIYQQGKILDYKTLEEKINLLLVRLIKEL